MKPSIRKGLRSIWWHPELVEGAIMCEFDIPFCPTTAKNPPSKMLTWDEAKAIFHRRMKSGDIGFKDNSFVCFYSDDYKFDTFRGIWFSPKRAMRILSHFKGIITPDFSTYDDFPFPLKIWNTYRMRAFGYHAAVSGLEVINNVRGRGKNDFAYCFNGIETHSIVAIGTVGSGLKLLENRPGFEEWLKEMVRRLSPKIILVYGSSNYACFEEAKALGIEIITYEASTSRRWKGRNDE